MNPVIEISKLSVKLKKEDSYFEAVKDISFSIPENHITAIVGESGSGKTLTAYSILQLLPKKTAVNGNIFFYDDFKNKINLLDFSEKNIVPLRGKKISMIFQEPMTALNPVLTCGKQLMEVITTHQKLNNKEAKQKAIMLLKQVELQDAEIIFNKYPFQLSGGQKQRVLIAMAISCNPALLIADEPTTAIDARVQHSIMNLLSDIRQKNKMSILLITHDLALAADFADEILVMRKGEIIEKGTPLQIFTQPEQPYTKSLLACRPNPKNKGLVLPVFDDITNNKIDKLGPSQTNFDISETNAQEILSIKDLKVYFPAQKNFWGKPISYHKAIDGISFNVYQNETIGVVGESGSGKTTLARTILQLINPTEGKILFKNRNILDTVYKKEIRKELQIVFQDPYGSLNPSMEIGEAITEPLKTFQLLANRHQRKDKAVELLKIVGLQPDHFHKFPHQFSGGQRQRICIARAMAIEPSFMIFDESVSALDVNIQAQILNLINELKSTHPFTSIFISHDLSVVHYISDRMLVMKNGKIIEQGKSDDIIYHPKHPYTIELIEAMPGKIFRNL